jgi:hypothetical protein
MTKDKLSSRGERIVGALEELADDIEAGVPIESKIIAAIGIAEPGARPPEGREPMG